MSQTPTITIVIPVRNRAGIILRTLESIHAQTFRPLRLIIVDNASTDSTLDTTLRWKSAHESPTFAIDIFSEPKPGASAARNRGLREVTSDYVMFFDSDDEMLPTHIERIVRYLSQHPDTDLLRWDIGIVDPDAWLSVKSHPKGDEFMLHMLHATLATQRYIVRTSLLRARGAWDETLYIWNDLELGARLLSAPINTAYLTGEPTVLVHPTEISITGTDYLSRTDGHTRTLAKIESILPSDPQHPHRLALAAKRAILAGLYRKEGNRDIASQLLAKAKSALPWRKRVILHLIYTSVSLTGHGGAAIAAMLLTPEKPDNRVNES